MKEQQKCKKKHREQRQRQPEVSGENATKEWGGKRRQQRQRQQESAVEIATKAQAKKRRRQRQRRQQEAAGENSTKV